MPYLYLFKDRQLIMLNELIEYEFFFSFPFSASQQTKITVVGNSLTTTFLSSFLKNLRFFVHHLRKRESSSTPFASPSSNRVPTRLFAAINQPPCACTPAHILSECYSRMRFRLCNQLRLRGRTIVPSFTFTSRGFVSFVLDSFIETKTNRIHRSPFPNMIIEIYVTASLNY